MWRYEAWPLTPLWRKRARGQGPGARGQGPGAKGQGPEGAYPPPSEDDQEDHGKDSKEDKHHDRVRQVATARRAQGAVAATDEAGRAYGAQRGAVRVILTLC